MKLTLNDLDIKKDGLGSLLEVEKQRKQLLKELQVEMKNLASTDINDFQKFAVKYWKRPDRFARECLIWPEGEKLTSYQEEILLAVPTRERVCVRGPRGLGKSALASITLLWFMLTRSGLGADAKALCTASSYNQLRRYFWPEVKKWASRLDWSKVGRQPFDQKSELLMDSLQLSNGEAFVLSPDRADLAEGLHASQVLVILDESKLIPEPLWDAIEGYFSGSGVGSKCSAFALAISTPGAPLGRFYRIQNRDPAFSHWWTRWVKLEEALAAGVITPEHVERLKRQWGEESSIYRQQVEGSFAADDESSIIPLDWILACVERYEEQQGYGTGESDSEW